LPQNLGYRKINAAFAEGYARNKDWNEAGLWARQVVGQIAGVDIPYFAVVDFSGFEKAIDQIGGVNVTVDRTFTDYEYPDSGTGYLPPQTFTQGEQHLNGARALIFARSRHAAGPEGSDFSRSLRQQKIMQAFKTKVQQLNLVTDGGQITSLLQTFASHFHTNLSPGQLLRLAKVGQKMNKDRIVSTSLDPVTGLICSEITAETKAYVLVPCYGKTPEDIQNFFQNALSIGKLTAEKSVVWIATANPKLSSYKRIEAALTEAGLTVWPIAYSDVEPEQSIVYQVNNKPATSEYLKSMLKTREVTVPPPNIKIDATRSDIILILGSNLPERFTKPLPAPLTPQAETQQNPNPRTDTPSLPSTNQPAPNLTTP
jgi:LCP family protein required for cell wall assembly